MQFFNIHRRVTNCYLLAVTTGEGLAGVAVKGREWLRDVVLLVSTRPRGRPAGGILKEANDCASASTFCGGE